MLQITNGHIFSNTYLYLNVIKLINTENQGVVIKPGFILTGAGIIAISH